MNTTAGRVPTLGLCCEHFGATGYPIQPAGQRERTTGVGSWRIHRKNQRSIAESFSQGIHTMFRTPVPANHLTSSFTRCCRRPSGLYDQPIPASLSQPLSNSPVIWNRVPSRVIESPFPKRRAESARGLR